LYIIKKFLTTFFFILGIMMVIAIIFDVSEKLDDFLKHDVPMEEIIFDYYVNFVFFYGNLFSPLLIFLSVIIFTSGMAYKSEIVAILASGISFNRLLVPYFIAASFLALISFYFNHFVVPHASKERLAFEIAYVGYHAKNPHKNLHKQIKPGHYIYVEHYNVDRDIGYKFTYEILANDSLQSKLIADYIQWDTTSQKWELRNYYIREFVDGKQNLSGGKVIDTTLSFLPDEFENKNYNIAMMDTPELIEFIQDEQLRGSELISLYEVEKNQRTAMPIATYILVLIGVSFASRKVRGGIGLHVAISVAISFIYIFAMQVTKVYATKAGLDPLIAVWIPNIFFGLLAFYFYYRAPK
ncbi:MAG: LptF/LptG family permease, partial [Salibacteraceae bacterium]